jgi:hypothetical protein
MTGVLHAASRANEAGSIVLRGSWDPANSCPPLGATTVIDPAPTNGALAPDTGTIRGAGEIGAPAAALVGGEIAAAFVPEPEPVSATTEIGDGPVGELGFVDPTS